MTRGQLILSFPHEPRYERAAFITSETNRQAFSLIDKWPQWPQRTLFLQGPAGSGKTHLAEIWRKRSGAPRLEAADIDYGRSAQLLAGGLLLVEDVTRLKRSDEKTLFHLLNLAQQGRHFLLLTSREMPGRLDIELPDLSSRLKALVTLSIGAPDDALLRVMLTKLFRDRQIKVEEKVVDHLILRMERSGDAARRLVDALDRLSLEGKRAVTTSLANQALAAEESADPEPGAP